jgi:guanylate kinase
MKQGLLIILSGPSGVGKGTIRKEVIKHKPLDLVYSISMTTRAKRPHEVEGVDYFFVSNEQFDQALKNGDLLESAEFVGNRYGTPKQYVLNQLKQGHRVFLEIEIEGARQVIQSIKNANVLSIFLLPPQFSDLEKRIRKRSTEPEPIIQERLEKAKPEMSMHQQYQHIVINDDIHRASEEIKQLILQKIRELERK